MWPGFPFKVGSEWWVVSGDVSKRPLHPNRYRQQTCLVDFLSLAQMEGIFG